MVATRLDSGGMELISNFLIGCSCNKNGSGSDRYPRFLDEKFHSPRVPPGDDQPLTEETVDYGYDISPLVTLKSYIFTHNTLYPEKESRNPIAMLQQV